MSFSRRTSGRCVAKKTFTHRFRHSLEFLLPEIIFFGSTIHLLPPVTNTRMPPKFVLSRHQRRRLLLSIGKDSASIVFSKSGFWLFCTRSTRSERIFSVFHRAFRVVRAIRVQRLVLSSDYEKTIRRKVDRLSYSITKPPPIKKTVWIKLRNLQTCIKTTRCFI